MPKRFKQDFSGRRFGRLKVLRFHGKGRYFQSLWECRCDCGTIGVYAISPLLKGSSKSCGCGHGVKLSDPITHEQLKKLVRYVKHSGEFVARRRWNKIQIGKLVGGVDINSGYYLVNLGGETYYGHVLAWFYVNEYWPEERVDHKNRLRSDNRWKNLRLASDSQNNANHPVRIDSRSGFKGVTQYFRDPKLWKAYIISGGKQKVLGYERTPEAAAKLYDAAAVEIYGKHARTNFGMSL